jgi:putative endonuclease
MRMTRSSSAGFLELHEPGADYRPTGDRGERAAESYLRGRGIVILERRFRIRGGEIDLIGREAGEIVFIEVKARSSESFGHPSEAITLSKQRRIIRAASFYLVSRATWDHPCRFDVVTVRFEKDGTAEIEHLRDAFRTGAR